MGGRHHDTVPGQPHCRLDEPRPGKAAEAFVQGSEPARQPGDGAGSRPDRVVDELLAEGDVQLQQLPRNAERWNYIVEQRQAGALSMTAVSTRQFAADVKSLG